MPSSETIVCVLTGRGMAAISSIALVGADARGILDKVFQLSKPTAKHSLTVPPNPLPPSGYSPLAGGELKILHGAIVDGERVIDEVVVGCEGEGRFMIHCHGNPLLVEQIVTLLQSNGAILIDADSFAAKNKFSTMIEAEARLAMRKSATLAGVKILQTQIDGGLSQWADQTLAAIDPLDREEIKRQCREILDRGKTAQHIIEGVRIVIAGAPNSGKSTLLNCLAGAEQVIVSDAAGTTRDWVSVTAHLSDGQLCAEFIDTAGLDKTLTGKDEVEKTAQATTKELLASCDLILYVQDVTTVTSDQLPVSSFCANTPIIYVNNKCDLVQGYKDIETRKLKNISISAKGNEGIDLLVQEILKRLGIANFDIAKSAAFTQRQRELLLAIFETKRLPKEALSELLYSKDCL
jgi:tRNA modification GTPase